MIMAQHPQQQQQQLSRQHGAADASGAGGGAIRQDNSIQKQKHDLEKQSTITAQSKSSNCNKSKAMASTTTVAPVGADFPSSIQQNSDSANINKENIHQQRHQQFQGQDGKRTLIKNQLYLIEQLQLENANLRNERDQLQLENEELKFQLQMIR